MTLAWKTVASIAIAVAIAPIPTLAGLPQHAWYFFAVLAGGIAAFVFKPMPRDAFGVINVAPIAGPSKHFF